MTEMYPFSDIPSLDTSTINSLREVLAEGYDSLVTDYLVSFPDYMSRLQEAIISNDSEAIFNLSHTLKSSSGSLGMKRLFTLLQHLEHQARSRQLSDAPGQLCEIKSEFELLRSSAAL